MSTLSVAGLESLLQRLGLEVPIPSFAEADVLNRPLDIAHSYLAAILSRVAECEATTAYNAVICPSNIDDGDFAIVLPKLNIKGKPKDVGTEIIDRFSADHPLFMRPFLEKVQLRIFLQEDTFARICIPYIVDRASLYGRNINSQRHDSVTQHPKKQRVIVEFSSPNLAGDFHGKYLRSTIIGAFIANLHEAMGWDVHRMNYLGDWGKPIGLLGVGWEKFGSEEAFKADPLGHLTDVYHQIQELYEPELAASKKVRGEAIKKRVDDVKEQADIQSHGLTAERNAFFKRMEEGEAKALAFWKQVRDVNVENYTRLYARLGVKFDEYSGESQVSPKTMAEVEQTLRDCKLCEENNGLLQIDLKKYKLNVVDIRDRSNSSTYLLRDLAAVLEREAEHSFDSMIYVAAADNNVHFSRVVKVLELMGKPQLARKLKHFSFSGISHVSDQLGDRSHTLSGILDRCDAAMEESMKANNGNDALSAAPTDATITVGVSALIAQELSTKSSHEHAFDLNHITSFANGTGAKMRWWIAWLEKAVRACEDLVSLSDDDWASIEREEEINLLRLLVQWPGTVQSTYSALEAATMLAFLSNVTAALSACVEDRGPSGDGSPAHLMLLKAALIVMRNGLTILGITGGIVA